MEGVPVKIAVLTPRHSLPMIQEVLQKNGILSQFGLVVYDSLTQLPDQYDGVKDKAQGILVTGKLPWRFLMAKRPNLELPVTCIAHSRLRSCLYLLRHLIDHPDIPLGETFCDFIHEIGDYATYADLLPPGQLPYTMFITGATERLIEETAGHVEELYHQKKIKMAYLTITQLYISLSERGVPCQHIGIQPEDILQAAQEALRRGSLERRDSRAAVAVLLEYGSSQEGEAELEYWEATLMKALVDYKRTLPDPREMTISRGAQVIEVNLTADSEDRSPQAVQLLQGLGEGTYRNAGVGLGPDVMSARESRPELRPGQCLQLEPGPAHRPSAGPQVRHSGRRSAGPVRGYGQAAEHQPHELYPPAGPLSPGGGGHHLGKGGGVSEHHRPQCQPNPGLPPGRRRAGGAAPTGRPGAGPAHPAVHPDQPSAG